MTLDTPIQELASTSGLTIKRMKTAGIVSFFDLLNHVPFRYEDYSIITPIRALQEGEIVTIQGTVVTSKNEYTRHGKQLQKITISDMTGTITVIWFNQSFITRILVPKLRVAISGTVKRFAGKLTLQPKEYEVLHENQIHTGRLIPIYPEPNGLSSKTIRDKMNFLINGTQIISEIKEELPQKICDYNQLMPLREAYRQIHFPTSREILDQARRRLAFDELFVIQLSACITKHEWLQQKVNYPFSLDADKEKKLNAFIANLPFELTHDQQTSLEEIKQDLLKRNPMNRFLQGDVGSGKTVIATIAGYIAYLNNTKTILMAPTEILAQQHYETISRLFTGTPVKVAIQTGSIKDLDGKTKYDFIVGTHALLSKNVELSRVGLTVIDEQHRFGVKQRALLKEKALSPHLLTMTATPIPRTVALTLYGELDLSVIEELPKGRIPIKTFLVPPEKRENGYRWIHDKIRAQHTQVFVICPLIDESEIETAQSVKAVNTEFLRLKEIFPEERVGLLHGKMKPTEKSEVMKQFKDRKIDILVSTSVVEVGIDIPNASIMIIEGADNYGLAQLHQLRGRVGRGAAQSFCFLFSDAQEDETIKRLTYFSTTEKGSLLAEYDLKHRGPGTLFGTKQHGYMKLKIASLSDYRLMHETKQAANYFFTHENLSEYPALKTKLDSYHESQISRD